MRSTAEVGESLGIVKFSVVRLAYFLDPMAFLKKLWLGGEGSNVHSSHVRGEEQGRDFYLHLAMKYGEHII